MRTHILSHCRLFVWVGFALGLWIARSTLAVEIGRVEIENRRCLQCHGQSHIAELSPKERVQMLSATTQPAPASQPETRAELFVDLAVINSSKHASVACVDCHQDAKALPHLRVMNKVSCSTANCHQNQGVDFSAGIHKNGTPQGEVGLPECKTCHGAHDILGKTERNSRTFPLNVIATCSKCHTKFNPPDGGKDTATHPVSNYMDSVHGRAIQKSGLSVAATCADCHSPHKVLPSKESESTVSRKNVATTCGKCHIGLMEVYQTSVHGELLAKGDPKAPVCNNCHTSHGISRTDTPAFVKDIVAECGDCHDQIPPDSSRKQSIYATYRKSYHGQVNNLGYARGARCSDCHGAHDIKKMSDPASKLSDANRVETCKKCHPQATASFAKFSAHADYRDSKNYPLLHGIWLYFVIMMSGAFGFFGLHSIFWLIRSVIDRIKHGPHPDFHGKGTAIKRFTRTDRVNHALVIVSFFGLTLTGLPLLFAEQNWAKVLAMLLGGVYIAGLLHRFFAIMLILNFVIHGVGLIRRFKRYGIKEMLFGPSSMMPRKRDITDVIGMWKWFFLGGHKPKLDRWTYWEKFDYAAEVGGSFIIGATGMVLWFPQFFGSFLPGWWFNVATLIHGYEAMLAIGFIFTIHFFNAHLRLEKFPVDDVMFTGSLPEEEFKEERPAEYERLVAEGKLDALKVAPPPSWQRKVAVAAGVIAMAIGTTLVVLIIMAGLRG
jgi:cytochrome b subunit of formate dehydrogenase